MQEIEKLQEAAARLPFESVFVSVSGAHLYGFASPDSDFDLRGAHALPLRELVGIAPPRETIEISETRDEMEWDIVSHDIGKFCRLLLKNSGYALEQLTSPLVVSTSPAHEELRDIALSHLNRGFARHYFGFAENQWKLFGRESPPRVKPLLYVFRVLLSGIHLLQSGRVEADLRVLNAEFRVPFIDELIALKCATQEKKTLPTEDLARFEAEYERLRARLYEAEKCSVLPVETDARAALDGFLKRLRLGENPPQ